MNIEPLQRFEMKGWDLPDQDEAGMGVKARIVVWNPL